MLRHTTFFQVFRPVDYRHPLPTRLALLAFLAGLIGLNPGGIPGGIALAAPASAQNAHHVGRAMVLCTSTDPTCQPPNCGDGDQASNCAEALRWYQGDVQPDPIVLSGILGQRMGGFEQPRLHSDDDRNRRFLPFARRDSV